MSFDSSKLSTNPLCPKPFLDLGALKRNVQAQLSLAKPKALANARIEQRKSASQKADEYARELEQRATLRRGITSNDADAMRFRWLCEHIEFAPRLVGQTVDEMRHSIDLWVKQQAIQRLSEMRRRYTELSGRQAVELTIDGGQRSAATFGTMDHQFPFCAERTLGEQELAE